MRNRFAIIFIFLFGSSAGASSQVKQRISLEDLIKEGNKKASEVVRSEGSGKKVPGYFRERAIAKGEEFNTKTDANLKSEAEQQIINARTNDKSSSGTTITLKSGERGISDLESMAKHEMFSKAKEIFVDPLKSFNGITKEECSRILESQKLQKKHKVREQKKTIEYEEKNCEVANSGIACEKFLEVTCDSREGECDRGGIILESVSSDMKFEYKYPTLTIGTIADNYWEGNCYEYYDPLSGRKIYKNPVYDRNTKFQVKNKKDIKEFNITEIGFDDFIWVKVNGITVYVGPYKGDRLELKDITEDCGPFGWFNCHKRGLTTDGNNWSECELGKSRKEAVTIDLLPHLKEGSNEIWIRVIVSGRGEGWVTISAKQHCCSHFKEQWRNRCYPN